MSPCFRASALITAIALTAAWGCQATLPALEAFTVQRVASTKRAAPLTGVSGAIRLPPRLIGLDGATLVGLDGATLVGQDGATLVGLDGATLVRPDGVPLLDSPANARLSKPSAMRRLMNDTEKERPLSGARVYLADAEGRALPGLPEGRTDSNGRFVLKKVPVGLTYVVVAEAASQNGKVARLTSLASTHGGEADVRIGLGTTMVTAALLSEASQGLGRIDNREMQAVAATVERQLDLARLPDLTDTRAVAEAAQAMVAASREVQAQLAPLQKELAEGGGASADLQARVQEQLGLPPDSPPRSPASAAATAAASGVLSVVAPSPSALRDSAATQPLAANPTASASLLPSPLSSATGIATAGLPLVASPLPSPSPQMTPIAGPVLPPPSPSRRVVGPFSVSTLMGEPKRATTIDGKGEGASFKAPWGLVLSQKAPSVFKPQGAPAATLLITQEGGDQVRFLSLADRSLASRQYRSVDYPLAVLVDPEARLLVGSYSNGGVYGVSAPWGWAFPALMQGTEKLEKPVALVQGEPGVLYVADRQRFGIFKYENTRLSRLAGGPEEGYNNGSGDKAQFGMLHGMVWVPGKGLYVADRGNHCIRLVNSSGRVTTVAGNPKERQEGHADGDGLSARFRSPAGLAADEDGNVYVSDSGNHCIRMITPEGVVRTIAGGVGQKDWRDDPQDGRKARFNAPKGIAVTPDGATIYVADTYNHCIRVLKRIEGTS
ncbi:MAG: hypothetical protein VKP62_13805 [Candidatus Sericytochromatia bacterium]|nr:hypothetical protein [Candidatus Sericytochromatia bacterium]